MDKDHHCILKEIMQMLNKQLEPYKESNHEYYLKLLGDIQKDINKFLNKEM